MQQGLKPGTTLRNGTYRTERMLGQGGFGITYLAVDLSLDRYVAIKEFFPRDYCDRDGSTSHVTLGTQSAAQFVSKLKAKFLKEAKNIAKFDNPGIIKIHAAFEENNTAYYVMDYIEGESLSAMVKRSGPVPEQTALRYIRMIGQALEYVHAHRINHLDVKPANIMVRKSDDRPILIDFGLSKQYDYEGNQTSTTPTGISHGFAPLEQYNDGGVKEFSPQTDLYSLAATLYYILSGVTPPQATLLIDEELTFPASIPPHLVHPITKAMAVTRRKRHESIARFLEDLSDDATTQIDMKPEPAPEPEVTHESESKPAEEYKTGLEQESRPGRKWWLIGAGAVITLIVLAVWFWVTPHAAEAESTPVVADSLEQITDTLNSVSEMYFNSSLGPCSYTGQVDADRKPHGHGTATWESGVAKSYDGEWVHGVIEGPCTYLSREGYRFEGSFKGGHYSQGTLTSPDGSYYKGTFDKDGNIWTGTEYDKNGNQTTTWKNGE